MESRWKVAWSWVVAHRKGVAVAVALLVAFQLYGRYIYLRGYGSSVIRIDRLTGQRCDMPCGSALAGIARFVSSGVYAVSSGVHAAIPTPSPSPAPVLTPAQQSCVERTRRAYTAAKAASEAWALEGGASTVDTHSIYVWRDRVNAVLGPQSSLMSQETNETAARIVVGEGLPEPQSSDEASVEKACRE